MDNAPENTSRGLLVHACRGDERTHVAFSMHFRGREVLRGRVSLARISFVVGSVGGIAAAFLDEIIAAWPHIRTLWEALCSC